MDYSKKTRDELVAICKEKSIKGYSGKKKDVIIKLLDSVNNKIVAPSKSKNISPLRYPGGKTRAINILYEQLITNFKDRKILLSPFFGGGSFELFLCSEGFTIYGNDLFTPLYTFWITAQKKCEILKTNIKTLMPVSKEKFHILRSTIIDEKDDIKQASDFFVINRTSFSGATLSGGFSEEASKKRFTESSITRISDCKLDSITFSNLDCVEFLKNYPESSETVIYADPPYYIKDYIYGKDGNMHESFDHKAFSEEILKRKDWMISYNDCEYIRNLYNGCRIISTSWSYSMNKSKASSEIIILPNFSVII